MEEYNNTSKYSCPKIEHEYNQVTICNYQSTENKGMLNEMNAITYGQQGNDCCRERGV